MSQRKMDEKSESVENRFNSLPTHDPVLSSNQEVRSYFHVNPPSITEQCSHSSIYIDTDYDKVVQPMIKKHKSSHHS